MIFIGKTKISFCDICGKRTDELCGRMSLTADQQVKGKGDDYFRTITRTVWTKRLCKTCLKKATNIETIGDKIKSEIESQLDALNLRHTHYELLPDMFGKECNYKK